VEVAGLHLTGELPRPLEVLREDTGGQTVAGVVGERDRVLNLGERVTTTAGPNSSSYDIFISGFTSATIVGAYIAPCRVPPVTRRAPVETASLIHSSTRIASFSLTMGPTFTLSSSWLPTLSAATFGVRASRKSA
jgi:hypothetical protein